MELPLTGQTIAHGAYLILDVIGQGGFGKVFKALQNRTGNVVAIKFLSLPRDFDLLKRRRYEQRFERECLLGSRLQHPNIVRLLDKGKTESGLLFAVFEYVEGLSLKQTLTTQGPLSAIRTAEMMLQVLDAIAYAHEQGVVHRDIKPANIMLSHVGIKPHVKVLDFGIGTLVNEVRSHDYQSITLTQETLGTPSYSAPEQLRGEAPTWKTDLYVWGLVFIECLTGEVAMGGANLASIFHKQLSRSNVPLPKAIAGHPVAGILRRVLQKNVNDRAANASEIYQQLSKINLANLVGHISPKPDVNIHDQATQILPGSITKTGIRERKQITALAVQLNIHVVERFSLDAELLETLHQDSIHQCIDIAVRYGAFHVGTLADTILFYFGYPLVTDNDPRLCARASLDIISNATKRNTLLRNTQGTEVYARVGVHTGLMTCYGDAPPDGETANIAIQLTKYAEKNAILCSQSSQSSLSVFHDFALFDMLELGIREQPTSIYKLLAEQQSEAVGFLRKNHRSSLFVGRVGEISRLKDKITQSGSESAQSKIHTHVSGEAGIGKSRLVYEFIDEAGLIHYQLTQCLPEHKNNALYPILNLIKRKFALREILQSNASKHLSTFLDQTSLTSQQKESGLNILLLWLNLPANEYKNEEILSPDQQKQTLFNTLAHLLWCQDKGLEVDEDSVNTIKLLIVEDLHWADPVSIEFIAFLIKQNNLPSGVQRILSTSRAPLPDGLPQGEFEHLQVANLSPESSHKFITSLFNEKPIAADFLSLLLLRTDGVPLFIEELVGMLKQKSLVKEVDGVVCFSGENMQEQLPKSLRESLHQKLDSLTFAKETVQIASVIGREFDYKLLVNAFSSDESQVQSALEELIETELIYRQRKVGGDSYIFKHALLRDAAYQSLLESQRKQIHMTIAEQLVAELDTDAGYSGIAHHYAAAQSFENALKHGIEQQKIDAKKNTHQLLIEQHDTLLNWNAKIDDKRRATQFNIVLNKIVLPSYVCLDGYSSANVQSKCSAVLQLIEDNEADVSADLSQFFYRISGINQFLQLHHSPHRDQAREKGETLLTDFRNRCDKEGELVLLSHLSQSYMMDGELHKSIRSFEYVIENYQSEYADFAFVYGTDILPHCHGMVALSYLHMGDTERAFANSKKAISYSSLNISKTIAYIFHILCLSMDENYQEAISACDYYNNHVLKGGDAVYYKAYIDLMHLCANDQPEQAYEIALEIVKSEQGFALGWYLPLIANTYLRIGQKDKANDMANLALKQAEQNGEIAAMPNVLLCKARCLLDLDEVYLAESSELIEQALMTAKQQNANFFIRQAEQLKGLIKSQVTV